MRFGPETAHLGKAREEAEPGYGAQGIVTAVRGRNPIHVLTAALRSAHVGTPSLVVSVRRASDPLADEGLEGFLARGGQKRGA